MTRTEAALTKAASLHAQHMAERIAARLATRGVQAEVRPTAQGFDIRVKNHGAAIEFGTFTSVAQPVVRTVIEESRLGVAS